MSTHHEPRQFLARGPCPRCGDRDLHKMEPPPENDPDMEDGVDHVKEEEKEILRAYGERSKDITIRHATHYWRADASTCDVVRTCRNCRERWPER